MRVLFTAGGNKFVQVDAHGSTPEEVIVSLMAKVETAARTMGITIDKASEFNRAPLAGELARVQHDRDKLRERRDRWRKRAEDAEARCAQWHEDRVFAANLAAERTRERTRERDAALAETDKLRAELERSNRARELLIEQRDAARAEVDGLRAELVRVISERDMWKDRAIGNPETPETAQDRFRRLVDAAMNGDTQALFEAALAAEDMLAESRGIAQHARFVRYWRNAS